MIELKLNRNTKVYSPGESVEVTVVWSDESPNQTAVVSLIWNTVGKGTTSTGLARQERVSLTASNGRHSLGLALPRGPLSCVGKLITIQWYVKAELAVSKTVVEEPFFLSYDSGPIQLSSLPICDDKYAFVKNVS